MLNIIDELIFRVANAWIWLTHRELRLRCIKRLGHFPDVARPIGHSALMQWRKVFDHNPLFVTFCDKLATREWAMQRTSDIEFSEVLWIGTDVCEVPAELLAGDVVLKVSSGSGSNYFPTRGRWEPEMIQSKVRDWLRKPLCGLGEWAYGRLPPRLFIERLHGTPDEVVDLNFRCQNGRIASAFAGFAWKTPNAFGAYLSADGRPLLDTGEEMAERVKTRIPSSFFDKAAAIVKQLSAGLDHVRVDVQLCGGKIYFGEMTVYSASGFGDEEKVGVGPLIERQWVAEIDHSWFLSTRQPWPVSIYQSAFRRWVRRRQAELGVLRQVDQGGRSA